MCVCFLLSKKIHISLACDISLADTEHGIVSHFMSALGIFSLLKFNT